MEEIDLKEIFNVLWRRKSDIISIVLAFFVLGCIYTLKYKTPVYTSSITLILASSSNDENTSTITTSDITLNSKLVATYSELLKSKTVLKEVISNLGIEMNEDTLKSNISISLEKDTELIKIKVQNEDGEIAADIANEIARIFPNKVKEMYKINNIQIIDEANVPTKPSNINHKKDVILFSGIGFVIASIYVIILNMLDTTIKTIDGVEKEFKLPVLASIPVMRK